MKTEYFKNHNGHQAESHTPTDHNGKLWEIRTSKARGGVKCTATECTNSGNGMISFDMFGAKRHDLASTPGNCTEKSVRETHEAGLLKFAEIMAAEKATEKEPYIIGIGQIVFTDGLESSRKRAVSQIIRPGQYKTVLLDGSGFVFDDHLKAYDEKLGIGTYYNEGEVITAEEVSQLVALATQAEDKRAKAQESANIAAKEERARKIAEGSKIIDAIPAGAVAVIVANLRKDESDYQTDYFHSTTVEQVFLSFSNHTRDIFSELRKAAANFEHTAQYSQTPERPADASEYWKPADEHREKYSMGHGYYLGESKYSGWIVEKLKLSENGSYGVTIEALQVAAAEGRYFCNLEPMPAPAAEFEAVEVEAGTIQIIEYSAKAIAVIGDTRPIKDKIKDLGGKFNKYLSVGPGWIFPKKDFERVNRALVG